MPGADLQLLIDAAKEAGRIATGYAANGVEAWDKPDGAGPVTDADIAVNDMLETELREARPDYAWLSEESVDTTERLSADAVFIIDPIDGTRSFIEGAKTWAHSIAIAQKGVVTAGVIYLPLLNLLYTAERGQGARLNGEIIRTGDQADLNTAEILATKPSMDPRHWKKPQTFTRHHRPSLAYRLSLVAQGRFDAMLTLRKSWEWDIAAGDLIVREAGATTSDQNGQPLLFNNADPRLAGVVAANDTLHADILKSLCD